MPSFEIGLCIEPYFHYKARMNISNFSNFDSGKLCTFILHTLKTEQWIWLPVLTETIINTDRENPWIEKIGGTETENMKNSINEKVRFLCSSDCYSFRKEVSSEMQLVCYSNS